MTLAVIDGGDQLASHALVLDAGVPAATAKLRIMSEGQGKVARIAVLPAHRGMGLATVEIRGVSVTETGDSALLKPSSLTFSIEVIQ